MRLTALLVLFAFLSSVIYNCLGCEEDQFQCNHGQCIPKDWICDHYDDCGENEDEKDCPGCGPNQFQCNRGHCITNEWICDDYDDCGENEDEKNCQGTTTLNDLSTNNGYSTTEHMDTTTRETNIISITDSSQTLPTKTHEATTSAVTDDETSDLPTNNIVSAIIPQTMTILTVNDRTTSTIMSEVTTSTSTDDVTNDLPINNIIVRTIPPTTTILKDTARTISTKTPEETSSSFTDGVTTDLPTNSIIATTVSKTTVVIDNAPTISTKTHEVMASTETDGIAQISDTNPLVTREPITSITAGSDSLISEETTSSDDTEILTNNFQRPADIYDLTTVRDSTSSRLSSQWSLDSKNSSPNRLPAWIIVVSFVCVMTTLAGTTLLIKFFHSKRARNSVSSVNYL